MTPEDVNFLVDTGRWVSDVPPDAVGTAVVSPAWVVSRLLVTLVLRLLFGWRIEGRENLPPGGYVAISNHLNWLDAFAVVLALPLRPKVHLLGWSAVLDSRKVSWLIRHSRVGFIPVERERPRFTGSWGAAMRLMHRCVTDGGVVCLFPEGRVGEVEGSLMPLHPGFAKLALAAGEPVVPIAVSGSRDLWLRKVIRVRIGPPIPVGHHDLASLAEAGRASLECLVPEYHEPAGPKLFRHRLTRLIPSLTNTQVDDD